MTETDAPTTPPTRANRIWTATLIASVGIALGLILWDHYVPRRSPAPPAPAAAAVEATELKASGDRRRDG